MTDTISLGTADEAKSYGAENEGRFYVLAPDRHPTHPPLPNRISTRTNRITDCAR